MVAKLKWLLIVILAVVVVVFIYSGSLSNMVGSNMVGQAPVAQVPLFDTYWRVSHVHNEPVTAREFNEAHLLFLTNGRLAGADGCNRISGAYRISGEQLAFGQLAVTRLFCEDAMTEAERFGRELFAIESFVIEGTTLFLLNTDSIRSIRLDAVSREQ
jgi:heat shock protein HslJ